ncbi:hypothetical protein B0T22DRAFT_467905 [Podospora appendiculata]|uniref:DUF4440 domain-containing protein n=1 Tax=Podospora appendiculata TaxID=314037 RepID=A0AAE0X277_9PEZI|nr:hypothetical protein B0T22DRAFT_467905 [Podospora appendiculata]
MPTVLGLTNDSKSRSKSADKDKEHKSSGKEHNQAISSKYHSSNKALGAPNNGAKPRLDTISKRNYAAALEVETLLWRALCDDPDAAKEYIADDCIMINPLFAGTSRPLANDTEPTIEQVLEGGEPWASFRFHGEPLVVEIGLMAVALVYKVSLYRQSKKGGLREVVASVSSSWRQTAGADWLLCSQHVAYADDDDEEEEEE